MKKVLLLSAALFWASTAALAQTFDEDMGVPQNIATEKQDEKKDIQASKDPASFIKKFISPSETKIVEKKQEKGNATIKRIYKKGQIPPEDENQNIIFLSMKDFKMLRLASSSISCTMRFTILTNLKHNVNSIDLRLKWPKMNTTLSFENVIPNQATYIDYGLLGEGCYTMNRVPNIEVNRCRSKGLSQTECSAAIRWIK